MNYFGNDLGMGANKLCGEYGGQQLPAQVAVNGTATVGAMLGLKSRQPPLNILWPRGAFYVGPGAHDWGRPVENLGYDRLLGTPEMTAIVYGSLTRYMQAHGLLNEPVSLMVGLPLEMLTGESASANVEAVRACLKGTHTWHADGVDYQVEIAEVRVTSQPVGALFDCVLDDEGKVRPERRIYLQQEVGIVSIGFNTIELLVVRDKTPVQKFTTGATSGVRRLLELVNGQRLYSLGELDAQLRAGQLDIATALPVWEREVTGLIEQRWGQAWRRFAGVLLVGGGALLLKESLPKRFQGKGWVVDEPVLSIARGLYKLSLSQVRGRK